MTLQEIEDFIRSVIRDGSSSNNYGIERQVLKIAEKWYVDKEDALQKQYIDGYQI